MILGLTFIFFALLCSLSFYVRIISQEVFLFGIVLVPYEMYNSLRLMGCNLNFQKNSQMVGGGGGGIIK